MNNFHRLLARQLKKVGLNTSDLSKAQHDLLTLVNQAYKEFDDDRALLEHAMDLSSREMMKKNEDLKRLVAASHVAVETKNQFLANMSHEIRTPMNGILGMLEILTEQIQDPEISHSIDLVKKSARSLLTVINDILDLSKLEHGKIVLHDSTIILKPFLEETLSIFSAILEQRAIEFVCHITPDVPSVFIADEVRLRQIFTNLMGNAVKFTNEGGGIILYIDSKTEDRAGELLVTLADSGIGIAASEIPSIFQAFTQADSSTTKIYGGTGLGLTITRQLVTLMGGEISVKSIPRIGSAFKFNIHYKRPAKEAKPNEAEMTGNARSNVNLNNQQSLVGVRVLLAEDNIINQKVALNILNKAGCLVTLAKDGQEAVNAVSQQKFDIALMDCQMPIMSGFEATRLIRRLEFGAQLPIVALTALAMEGDHARCLEAGMDDYLAKPFQRSELISKLNKFFTVS